MDEWISDASTDEEDSDLEPLPPLPDPHHPEESEVPLALYHALCESRDADLFPDVLCHLTLSHVQDVWAQTHPPASVPREPPPPRPSPLVRGEAKLCDDDFLLAYREDVARVAETLERHGVALAYPQLCDFVLGASRTRGRHRY